jgi:DNA-binding beta-propeller fold protein YncE
MTANLCRAAWAAAALALAAPGCGDSVCEPESGTICTVAGTGIAGYGGDDGLAVDATLYLPQDVTVGPDGRLYLTDWNNHRVRSFAVGGDIRTVAGTGLIGDGPAGPALDAAFNHPTQVVFDGAGGMYIAAWHNSRINRVEMSTGEMSFECGTGARAYWGDGGPAAEAALDLPAGLAFGPSGDLFVIDQANQVIRRIDAAGVITRFAGTCLAGEIECGPEEEPVPCPGTDKWACGLDVDPDACDKPCEPGYGGDGGHALEARLSLPFGQAADPAGKIAFDTAGNLFIADSRNHRIRRIDASDRTITTVAGTGERGHGGDGGPATAAQLNNPVDLAIAPDDTIYVTDTANSCVRAIAPDGLIRTVAGVCGQRGFEGDGDDPTLALLDRPYGIELDRDGNLYIVDTYNHRVRVVSP